MITAPVLVATTGYTAWRFSGGIGSGVVAVALTATATAVASHELGHIIAARLLSGKVSHGYWRSGVLLSLGVVLLPVEMGLGPYVGHAVESRTARRKWWISFAGPLANLAMAAACYALFIVEPLPVLRVMAQAQLAVCAYALLPMKPLDGEELKKHRWVVLSVSLLLVWAGIAFTAGYL